MAEATKIDWAEELREEMKRGREGAAKNALSGEDDTFAEWSESFEEGQSPADLAGAESEGAGVGWTLSEMLVPGVGEAMDLRMMEEGRREGDQTKVAMGMIGLALPGALGAVWRKFGGPVARRVAKMVSRGEMTPKEAAVRAAEESLKNQKAYMKSTAGKRMADSDVEDMHWDTKQLTEELGFVKGQPEEWFTEAASVRNVDQARDRLVRAQRDKEGVAKAFRKPFEEREAAAAEALRGARSRDPMSKHKDLLAEADRASVGRTRSAADVSSESEWRALSPERRQAIRDSQWTPAPGTPKEAVEEWRPRMGEPEQDYLESMAHLGGSQRGKAETASGPLARMREDRNKVVQRIMRKRGASPDDATREALNKHLVDPDVMEARGHLPPVKGEMKWEWEPGERMESALYDRSLPRQPRWKGTDEAGEVTEVWEELASPSRSKVRQHGTPIKGSGQVVYGEW